MDVRYLLLLFLLVSCLPEAQVSRSNLQGSEGTTSGSTTGETSGGSGAPIPTTALSFNYLGAVSQGITINASNLNNANIIGTMVQTYLSDFTNFSGVTYCLVSTFNVGGTPLELRSRVIPVSYYDFTQKRTVRVFRIDFPETTASLSNCAGTLFSPDASGSFVAETSPATSYAPQSVCPTCTTILSSSRVRIFKKEGTLRQVPSGNLNTSTLSLRIDPNNSTSDNNTSCSNTSCQSRGFDCCLDNQCVNDGAEKASGVSQFPDLYATAEAEKLENPLAYLNYPQLYYICSGNTGTTTGSTTGGGYDEEFEKKKKDYACLQHLKSQTSTVPFQSELLTYDYDPAVECLTEAGDEDEYYYYKSVVKRMYEACDCNKSSIELSISECPAFDYEAGSFSGTEPTEIHCTVQEVDDGSVPVQSRVSVSSRSAPHRFFDSSGVEKVLSGTVTQEGPKFQYLDDEKIIPSQSDFSMNALLGQMSVTLDQALPAKVVSVNLDEVYLISTVSGTYTPCPTCGKDSWLDTFSAHPFSSNGSGLQGLSLSTERDNISPYSAGANYEDTIFGRACWLPPTMVPFSHSPKSGTQAQRLNRLQTQAALYANGYQRDWYGFNKGALIGSFDGVTWFAVGRGRIVRSTSTKLFLAINAPFADLAVPSIHEVNIEEYNGITKAPAVDYDPAFHVTDINQNQGGTCQANHMCQTDTDCVTRLGWEYMCADVKDIKTQWPEFDSSANEIPNSGGGVTNYDTNGNPVASTAKTIDQILAKKGFPSSSTKRCVYRGAGAPCVVNPTTISDLNRKKTLTCAPNFFCANVSSGGLFNGKVARFAASVDEVPLTNNHLFGKDANVLGRPLSYLSSSDTRTLESDIQSTLRQNIGHTHSLGNSMAGICRPGKALPTSATSPQTNPFSQHQFSDGSRRTDFISQIASCNPTLYAAQRQSSCPVIAADGNYEMFATATIATDYHQRARTQNVCGLQSLFNNVSLSSNADAMLPFSPFRSIEAKPLPNQTVIERTLVRDACLRRAGQVCQTDLDCSPNKLHAEQTDVFSLSYFGNEAEKSYYSEYLVCGQADPKPAFGDLTAYKAYDMSKNRCCREVGKDLTTFTNFVSTATAEGSYDSKSLGLKMSLDSGTNITMPNDPKRYSRLATVEGLGSTKPLLSGYQNRDESTGLIEDESATSPVNALTEGQWKTLGEANSETCCGGGWIRKFADGSTNWAKTDRVVLDVTNFRCLNSRTVMLTRPDEVASEYGAAPLDPLTLVEQDEGFYCKDGTNTTGACAMYAFANVLAVIEPEVTSLLQVSASTRVPTFGSTNLDNYFSPNSADENALTVINYGDTGGRRNIALKIPSFITEDSIPSMLASVAMDPDSGADVTCTGTTAPITSLDPLDDGVDDIADTDDLVCAAGCCYQYDATQRILVVLASDALATGAFDDRTVGVNFTADPAGRQLSLALTPTIIPTKPGSNAYYLKRFGRLELSGIPQVPVQPIYCNDNSNVLVPGIFDLLSGITNKDELETNASGFAMSFKDADGNTFMNHTALVNEPVFSANDFKCCTPLGKTATSASNCCSGFGTATSSTSVTCKLPARTDLMVYFNRFVSNEGRGTDQPGGGLVDTDFEETTGEPKLSSAVNLKITELGRTYCSSGKVRQGGAFGRYEPEPQGPLTNVSSRIYNIVDSTLDAGQNSNAGSTVSTGHFPFTQGFRWNHHLYCDD